MRSTTVRVALLSAGLIAGPSLFAQGQGSLHAPTNWEAHPPIHARPDATTSPTGYVPKQILHAYGVDLVANHGAGQVIAIVDAYGSPTAQNDLNVFSAKFGIAPTTIQFVYGGARPRRANSGWALETSLDLQWAHAIAPDAKLVLAVAASASITDLTAAIDAAVKAGATVVSMSWGGAEFSSEANYESHFQKPGVTFFASSGDSGSGSSWPAASPTVVSVGGTHLPLDASGNLTGAETAWSGSGGGFSTYFSRPTFQNSWQSNGQRAIPDVSLVADPATGVSVYDTTSYNGQSGWFVVGGTSASSPMWSAIVALANVAHTSGTLTGNTALYSLAGKPAPQGYSYYFFDVTSGSNGGFSAAPLYDEVTGLGTPIAGNVALSYGQ